MELPDSEKLKFTERTLKQFANMQKKYILKDFKNESEELEYLRVAIGGVEVVAESSLRFLGFNNV